MKYYILNNYNKKIKKIEAESPLFLRKYASGYKAGMYYISRYDGKIFNDNERKCLGVRPSYVKDRAIWIDEELQTSFTAEDLAISFSENKGIEYNLVHSYIKSNMENLRSFDYPSAYMIISKALCTEILSRKDV